MKHFFLIFTLLSIIFTSCATKAKDNRTIINLVHWESGAGYMLLKKMIADFEALNPTIKIMESAIPVNKYPETLLTRLAGESDIDIFEIMGNQASAYVSKGLALNLTPYQAEHPELAPNLFFKEAQYFFTYDENGDIGKGSTWGYAKDFSINNVIFANVTHFQKQALSLPTTSLDFDKWRSVQNKLITKDNAGFPITYASLPFRFQALYWAAQTGNSFYSADGTKAVFNTTEVAEYLHKQLIMWFGDKASPIGSEAEQTGTTIVQQISSGKFATIEEGRWAYANIKKYSQDEWTAIPRYSYKGIKPAYMLSPAAGWMIKNRTPKKKESLLFLKYLVSERGNRIVAKAGYNVPSLITIANSTDYAGIEGREGEINKSVIKWISEASYTPFSRYINDIELKEIIKRHWEPMVSGRNTVPEKIDVEEMLEKMVTDINNKISDKRMAK